jgi:benzoyl-CoA 2,3-dioxygenase component B
MKRQVRDSGSNPDCDSACNCILPSRSVKNVNMKKDSQSGVVSLNAPSRRGLSRSPDWLSFFMFTFFTDRDGKMQLHALSQSGFDPLSRTCRFMLTEEAHHMFVGQSGVGRIIECTVNAMRAHGIDDPTDIERVRKLGVIDLPTLQKRANLHFSLTLDLFGSEISTNAANAFNASLKGRYLEDQVDDDHQLLDATYPVLRLRQGHIVEEKVPALSALNMRLRDDYIADAASGIERWWNRIIARAGIDYRIRLPHVAFNRRIGEFAAIHADPDGNLLNGDEWQRRHDQFLPTTADNLFIESLMRPVTEPGGFASWIAPPRAGIDGQPGNFEYVKLAAG